MKTRFRVGESVTLKSGGPKMTVTEFRRKKVEVAYFTADQRCVRESFPFSALVGEGPASDGRPTEDRVARA